MLLDARINMTCKCVIFFLDFDFLGIGRSACIYSTYLIKVVFALLRIVDRWFVSVVPEMSSSYKSISSFLSNIVSKIYLSSKVK